MKPARMLFVGLAFILAILVFELSPKWLTFAVGLVSLTCVGWGIVIFPRLTANFEMRLPDLVGVEHEERLRIEGAARMQGAPLPYGEKRVISLRVQTKIAPVLSIVATVLIMTYFAGNSRGMLGTSDAEVGRSMLLLYATYLVGAFMIALGWRWYLERAVLHNASVQFILTQGDRRAVRYSFRDTRGEFFGSMGLRTDQSWRPGEFDLVLYSPANPSRSFTASTLFFHRIRRVCAN